MRKLYPIIGMEIGVFVLRLHKLLRPSLAIVFVLPLSLGGEPLVSVTLVDLVVSCVCSFLYISVSCCLVSVHLLRDVLELHYAL